MITNWVILDISTAPIPDAATYLDGTVRAPANYKDADKIAAYIAEETEKRTMLAATDIDLARVIGYGMVHAASATPFAHVNNDPARDLEAALLTDIAADTRDGRATIVTFGGFAFDLPLLMRRARYLGVDFPTLNLDRYRSPHLDLCEILSDRNASRRRSLQFYAKRLGWADIHKPLSGAEESRVPETGQWDALAASLRHDVTATYRLACWLGLIQPVTAPQPEPVF